MDGLATALMTQSPASQANVPLMGGLETAFMTRSQFPHPLQPATNMDGLVIVLTRPKLVMNMAGSVVVLLSKHKQPEANSCQ